MRGDTDTYTLSPKATSHLVATEYVYQIEQEVNVIGLVAAFAQALFSGASSRWRHNT